MMEKGKLAQINSITDTVPFKHSHTQTQEKRTFGTVLGIILCTSMTQL